MTTPIDTAQQQLQIGNFVELFTLDATPVGGGVLYWTPSRPQPGQQVIWQGNVYTSVDVKAEGFEKSVSGTLPRPQLSIGNADNIVGALLSQYGDVLGCTVTRTKTLAQFLDGQPDADPTAEWPVDIYRVERKVTQNKNLVVIELAAATDNAGVKLPGRTVLRGNCLWIYRVWDGTAFDYANATCPYAGTACFNKMGQSVALAADDCGKQVSDCKLRFGAQAVLPFGGFPGVSKVRLA